MNMQKLTQKSLEAIQAAQNLAIERSHVNVDCQHLLEALLIQENGLIPALLQRMGVDTASLRKAVDVSLDKIPGVTGPGREEGKIYVSSQLDRALTASERTAESMNDEYISVEHLFLGLLEHGNAEVKDIFRNYSIDKNSFLHGQGQYPGDQRYSGGHL